MKRLTTTDIEALREKESDLSQLRTETPLAEKDEVKKAEKRTAGRQLPARADTCAEHKADEEPAPA